MALVITNSKQRAPAPFPVMLSELKTKLDLLSDPYMHQQLAWTWTWAED
jgi:hypothetical protein